MTPVSANPPPIILIFGDSLSAGYGIDREKAWPQLLSGRLQARGYDYRVINASISGETTAGGLTRFSHTLQQYRPELLVLELGANDGLRGLDMEHMRANLQRMISQAINSDVRVLLVGMRIPSNYGPVYTESFHGNFTRLARDNPVGFLPFLLEGIALDTKYFQQDGIHPTAAAQPAILENIWQQLQPMLKQPGA